MASVLRKVCCRTQGDHVRLPVKTCQSMIESVKQSLRAKHLDTGCRQFDRQRQPIESQTDLGDGRSIVRRQVKIGSDGLCPLNEQVHRCNMCEPSFIWEVPGIRQGEGWNGELVFGAQAQDFSARDKNLQIGAGFQQFCKLQVPLI